MCVFMLVCLFRVSLEEVKGVRNRAGMKEFIYPSAAHFFVSRLYRFPGAERS